MKNRRQDLIGLIWLCGIWLISLYYAVWVLYSIAQVAIERVQEKQQVQAAEKPKDVLQDVFNTVSEPCLIKGNISTVTGEYIYHKPGGLYYDVTDIDESTGEEWFCTAEEAEDAGWRESSQ